MPEISSAIAIAAMLRPRRSAKVGRQAPAPAGREQRRIVARDPQRQQDRERHLVEGHQVEVQLADHQAAGQERVQQAGDEGRHRRDPKMAQHRERRQRDERKAEQVVDIEEQRPVGAEPRQQLDQQQVDPVRLRKIVQRQHARRAELRVRQVPAVVDDRLHHHREEDGVAAIVERDAQVGPPEPQRQDGLDAGGERHAAVKQESGGAPAPRPRDHHAAIIPEVLWRAKPRAIAGGGVAVDARVVPDAFRALVSRPARR